ncbi:GDP-mannose 4,6-dehydratase [Pontibacter toksunensis]|uniref:GDP-mannose 4,6-dehydratase n=1 Tax=Pontibacter toksunensis TaxID=1332631 RepID=A0ABW6BYX1_9BACT
MHKKIPKCKVIVTGGAGFIGSHLTDNLLSAGYAVKVLDNLSNGSRDNLAEAITQDHFTFIEGDILNKQVCQEAMQEVDYVFHLACLGVRHSLHSPFENHKVNAEGTLNILEAAKRSNVQHFFYISTSEVYGRTTDFPITESSPTNPLTVYGASKLAGEHYTKAFHECYQLPVTVLRIFNNYGPRAHYEGDAGEVIPRSIVRILYEKQPVVFGDGSVTRDFFFVKDTAAALVKLLEMARTPEQEEIVAKTFNIGTGTEISMKELMEKVLHKMGKNNLTIAFKPDRPADVPRLWVKADNFTKFTGFKPSYSFDKGLEETINYYSQKIEESNLLNEVQEVNWIKENV